MAQKRSVLIIAGGITHERDVSIRSGRRVANLLHLAGFTVQVRDLNAALIPAVQNNPPDVIWPLVHGSVGEDGSLQALLENLGVPFVGSNSVQAMLASNKPTAKGLVAASGVATPGWVSMPQQFFRQLGASQVLDTFSRHMTFPVVVKPSDGGSALGLSFVRDAHELNAAMVDAFAYGERVMVEQAVHGRDIAVSILDLGDGPQVLPPIEIATDDGDYDYEARYTTDSTQYFVPARLSADKLDEVTQAALHVHSVLGLRHYSRIDFVMDDSGTAWFIDANVTPGMTDTSLFPQACDAAGSFAQVCVDLVNFAADQGETGTDQD